MVLDDVFQLFDVGGRRVLRLLGTLADLEPLLEPPKVVVQLGPVAFSAERTEESPGLAIGDRRVFNGVKIRKSVRTRAATLTCKYTIALLSIVKFAAEKPQPYVIMYVKN